MIASMDEICAIKGRPRWLWEKRGSSRLLAADGTEFFRVDSLSRVEIERLLTLGDLDAAEVGRGVGIVSWAGPTEAEQLWRRVEALLVESVHRPLSHQPGEYRAELWRAEDGRHVMGVNNE